MRQILLIILLLFLSAPVISHPKGEVEVHREDSDIFLEVRPLGGEPWRRKVKAVFAATAGATDEFVAVGPDLNWGEVQRFDWEGNPLSPIEDPGVQFEGLWEEGSRLYGLEHQDQTTIYRLMPSEGSGLWVWEPGERTFRPLAVSEAERALEHAAPRIALAWYAAHSVTPPPSFQPDGVGPVWELGLKASRGDQTAADRLKSAILANGSFLTEAKALALSGTETLRPVLMEKARTLFGSPEQSLYYPEWTCAMYSLRNEYETVDLEGLPAAAIDYLPARAALERRRELIAMAIAGRQEAASVLCRSIGDWAPELPVQLLQTEGFPQAPLLESLAHVLPPAPETIPILLGRLDQGEAVYDALRRQSGQYLPADKATWRSWWAAQNGRPPSIEIRPYTWLMHALAEQGLLTPQTLARHPRLVTRLALPLPYGLSADGESLEPLRGAFDLPSYDFQGNPLPGSRSESPQTWGVIRREDLLQGSGYLFRTPTTSIAVSDSSMAQAGARRDDSFKEWLESEKSSIYFNDGGGHPSKVASDIDPRERRVLVSTGEGVVVTDRQGESRALRAEGRGHFLPDGDVLIARAFEEYSLWDGQELQTRSIGADRRVTDHAPDRLLIVGKETVEVQDGKGKTVLRTFPADSLQNFFFSLDGRFVFSPGTSQHFFDVETGKSFVLPSFLDYNPAAVTSDASGRRLAITDSRGNLAVWDLYPEPESWKGTAAEAVEEWTGTQWESRKVTISAK